jgi:DNA polymerase-3 subunit epsilon
MRVQADLIFGPDEPGAQGPHLSAHETHAEPQVPGRPFRLDPAAFEDAAAALEASGHYRILRRLPPRPVAAPRHTAPGERIAVVVDTETTGLDRARDEIIEIGMVAFTYAGNGQIGDVVDTFSALREPTVPIPPGVTRLTGITPDMVKGCAIDPEAVEAFIAPAQLVIAHNARFDRPFCERLVQGFVSKAWACSHSEVPWPDLGFEGSKLGYLLAQCGWFHQGHRAVEDCHALLAVLAARLPGGDCAMAHLLASARRTCLRVWAEGSPFAMKDELKRRGYRWNDGQDGRPRCWFVDVAEDAYAAELTFLRQVLSRHDVEPFTQRITAFERFRAPG